MAFGLMGFAIFTVVVAVFTGLCQDPSEQPFSAQAALLLLRSHRCPMLVASQVFEGVHVSVNLGCVLQ